MRFLFTTGVHGDNVAMTENRRTLQQLVDEDGLCRVDEAARYVRLAAERLADLHKCNVVHKNLRPSTSLLLTLAISFSLVSPSTKNKINYHLATLLGLTLLVP